MKWGYIFPFSTVGGGGRWYLHIAKSHAEVAGKTDKLTKLLPLLSVGEAGLTKDQAGWGSLKNLEGLAKGLFPA